MDRERELVGDDERSYFVQPRSARLFSVAGRKSEAIFASCTDIFNIQIVAPLVHGEVHRWRCFLADVTLPDVRAFARAESDMGRMVLRAIEHYAGGPGARLFVRVAGMDRKGRLAVHLYKDPNEPSLSQYLIDQGFARLGDPHARWMVQEKTESS